MYYVHRPGSTCSTEVTYKLPSTGSESTPVPGTRYWRLRYIVGSEISLLKLYKYLQVVDIGKYY
jgi:hypothetical protein